MIENVDVSKLNAGTISTDKFLIRSNDGGIEIRGATQQFKDKNNKVRLQLGKDSQGNFNFILRGEDGTSVLLDHTGLKAKAITDGLIVNNMLGQGAVTGDKVNIGSLIQEVNKDTNTSTIKATKIQLDKEGQSLDIAFNTLKTNVNNIQVGGRNLIKNSLYKKGNENWSLSSGIATIDNETLHNGHKTVKIQKIGVTTSTWGGIRQDNVIINPKQGEMYTLSYWYLVKDKTTLNDIFALELKGRTTGGADTGLGYTSISPTTVVEGEWTKVSYVLNITRTDLASIFLYGWARQSGVIWFSEIKAEKGNKATDFTEAPEDIENRIESNTTQITAQQGKIEALISDTSIVEDGATKKLKDAYANLKLTVDGLNSTVGSHTTNITNLQGQMSTANGNISKIDGKVQTVESKQVSFEQNLNGISQKVSSAESNITTLKGQMTTANNNISAIDGKVTTTSNKVAELTTNLSSITQKVSAVETTTATLEKIAEKMLINNFSRSGTKDRWTSNIGTITSSDAVGYYANVSTNGDTQVVSNKFEIDSTKTYKISLMVQNPSENGTGSWYFGVYAYDKSGNNLGVYIGTATSLSTNPYFHSEKKAKKNTSWRTFESYVYAHNTVVDSNTPKGNCSNYFKFHPKTKYLAIRFLNYRTTPDYGTGATGSIYFAHPTISEVDSNIASTNTNIANLTTEVTTTKNKVVSIETNLNGITSKVSSVESSVATINGNVTSLQNRMSTAEQKITSDSIVSTVRSSTAYTNDLNAKANQSALNTTNSNLSGLTTRVNSVEQKITPSSITTTISSAINGGTSSISTTQFVMDKNGFLVKNGALRVQNKAGQTVLSGDSNGNLLYTGALYSQVDSTHYAKLEPILTNGNRDVKLRLSLVGNTEHSNFDVVNASGTRLFKVGHGGVEIHKYLTLDTDQTGTYNTKCYWENGTYRPAIAEKALIGTNTYYFNTVYSRFFGRDRLSGSYTTVQAGAVNIRTAYQGEGCYFDTGGYFRPAANGAWANGHPNYRWSTVYSVNGINASSDLRLKENVEYIKESNDISTLSIGESKITQEDMYNFMKDEFKLVSYNYKGEKFYRNSELSYCLGFIAQDLKDSKVGKQFIIPPQEGEGAYSYNMASYIGVLVGALRIAVNKIETLEYKIEQLEVKGA